MSKIFTECIYTALCTKAVPNLILRTIKFYIIIFTCNLLIIKIRNLKLESYSYSL